MTIEAYHDMEHEDLDTLAKEFEELQRRIALPSGSKAALELLNAELDGLYQRLFAIEDDSDRWNQLDERIEEGVEQLKRQLSACEDSEGPCPSTEPEPRAIAIRPTILFSPVRVGTQQHVGHAKGTPPTAPWNPTPTTGSPPSPGSMDVLAQKRLDVQYATQNVEDAKRMVRQAELELERAAGDEARIAKHVRQEVDGIHEEWVVLKKATIRSYNHRKGGAFAHCCGNHNRVGVTIPTAKADGSPGGTIVIAKPGATPQKVSEGESHGGEVLELIDGHFIKVKTSKGKVLCQPVNKH